ncbi:MAG TPA: SUMF1/EgtB/PvdO family nonheme iron enzyme, partial [Thermotogota bacterium]|nr:SUMF1/EgtB/PvdO family nonheme iron enzyme [Thermotogota bacterium]
GGVLLVGLSKGIHRVAIQGNEMESEEFQVALTDEFTVHTVEVIGQGVQRTVVIQTQPSEARIEINGEELQMLSPTTYKTNVGDTLHIRAHKEGYNIAEMEQRIGEKGVPLEVTLHLERNNPPEMPVQLAPGNTETGTTPLLQWMANDTDDETLLFDVFFLEASQWKQVAQGLATPEFQVSGLAYGNQYSWKVVVTDGHGNQTEGIPWSFSTQDLPQTLRVQIVSEPEGAQVEVDDLHIGMAPVNIELQAGDHQVRVSEEGYFTEEKTISVDISGGNPKSLQRERTEQFVLRKKTGRATIATEPGGGDIYINGVYEGTGFLTIEEEEGDISVKVEKEGYQPKTQSIKIEAGKEITQIIVLEKDAPGTGILRVSNPEKLSIYVDGKFVGWDKAFEMEAEEGIHTVELKRAGRTVSRQMISVEKAQEGGKQPQETTQTIVIGTRGEVPPGMVLVQAGSFQMGNTRNDNEGEDSEKPVHEVTFTYDYLIGRYEVTFDEFDTYSSATGRIPPDDLFMGRGSRPVINVSWEEAIGYCNWLSEKEGLANAYDKNGNLLDRNGERTDDLSTVEGYRLPTEAEWEYAARGGHKSVQDFKYAGSNNISLVGWYDTHEAEQESTPGREQSSGPGFFQFNVASVIVMDNQTHFGGELEPNELGVYDMSGNVSEWCHDWWDPNWYEQGAQTNPIGPRTGAFRVQRGGSWTSTDARLCRIAYRFRYKPTSDCEYIGFRLAKTY